MTDIVERLRERPTQNGHPYYTALDADTANQAAAEIERLRAAIAWIEPPFVDEKTPEAELRQRIAFAVADAKRAALTAQSAAPGGE